MSDVSNATTIAPSHPAGVGSSIPGGHVEAFRAEPSFEGTAKLNVIGSNMRRPGTSGHRFYAEVLAKNPATVQAAIDLAKTLAEPINAKQVQAHLRWLYTANGAFLEVDGVRFVSAPVKATKTSAKKPVKATKKSKAKAA